MARVSGKAALVSDGARGLGAAQARLLVHEGAKVVIGDILDDDGRALAAELGDSVRFVHLDLPANHAGEVASERRSSGRGR